MPEDEATRSLKAAMATFLDMSVRLAAVQLALEQNNLLTRERVEHLVKCLKATPQMQQASQDYGQPTLDIEALLRNFEGTVQ